MGLSKMDRVYLDLINPSILGKLSHLYAKSRMSPYEGPMPINRVVDIDAVAFLSAFPNDSVDLVFTDEPYGAQKTRVNLKARTDITTDFKWDADVPMSLMIPWVYEAYRILKPGGALVNCGFPSFSTTYRSVCIDAGFRWRTHRAWFKTNCAPHFRLNNWVSAYEVVWIAQKGEGPWKTFNFQEQRVMQNMIMQTICLYCGCVYPSYESNTFDRPAWFDMVDWNDVDTYDISSTHVEGAPLRQSLCPRCNRVHDVYSQEAVQDALVFKSQYIASLTGGNRQHPTKKPDWLAIEMLNILTEPGDVVVDPFCGEGTFVISAAKLGRVVYGNDLDPRWSELADERVREALGKQHTPNSVKRKVSQGSESIFDIINK